MSTLTQPFTFTPGTYAVASQVNADMSTIYGWINGGSAIWADASRAFTAVPSGPAADPVSANQFTRKSYVDKNLRVQDQSAQFIIKVAPSTPVTPTSGVFAWTFTSAFPTGVAFAFAQVTLPAPQNKIIVPVQLATTFISFRVLDCATGALDGAAINYTAIAIGY